MRDKRRGRPVAGMALAGGLLLAAAPTWAQPTLSLRRVLLSQGGVGYFEYAAAVDGDAALTLDVPRDQVSDVLKSLVVLDAAGSVASVELPSAEGATPAALAGLPLPRAALDRPLDLLNALQGVVVTVAGATPMTGRILHAEPPPLLPPDASGAAPTLGKTRVTLLTAAGLQQFLLEDVAAVQVADPALRARLEAAVAALRGTAAGERRQLVVRVEGSGARTVHLGVVVAAPLWKATYRLVQPEGDAGLARLQAWAVLENAGLQDWNDVALTLQAGGPVAFRQALYQAYMVDRPELPVDLGEHPAPPADTRSFALAAAPMAAPMAAMAMPAEAPAPMAPPSGVAVAESGVETTFALPRPVSLAAGHTAAVPFLDRAIPAERLDLLAAHATHPLAAIRLTNDSGAALPPGIVTTYGPAGFTGDAALGALPAGESRLLSFAQDQATGALWRTAYANDVVGVAASSGVLRLTRRERTTTTVTLTAPPGAARRVLVEIPRGAATAISTEPALPVTQTATAWRLEVALKPGEQRRVVAYADRLVASRTVLEGDPAPLLAVLSAPGLTPTARAALQHVADLAHAAAERAQERDRLTAEQATIEQDETRLRANLAVVPETDPLHGQLLRSLSADEDRLAQLAARRSAAEAAVAAARQALAAAITALSI